MQGLIEKREKNREKQKKWREQNLEKSNFMGYNSNRKLRGQKPISFEEYQQRPTYTPRLKKTIVEYEKPIDVSLCLECGKRYLTKLRCLWCNDFKYGKRTDTTDN